MRLFLSWNAKIQNKVSVFESVLLWRIRWKESWKNLGTFYLPYFRLRKNEYLFLGTHLAEGILHVNVTLSTG